MKKESRVREGEEEEEDREDREYKN